MLGILSLLFIAPVPIGRTVAEPNCSLEVKWSRSKDERADPPDGIPLFPRLMTGMTREEVRRVSPLLTKRLVLGNFEFVPGVVGAARAAFSDKTARLEAVYMRGSHPPKAMEAMIRAFGPPQDTKLYNGINDLIVGRRFEDDRTMLWCVDQREIVMQKRDDWFTLSIEPSRFTKAANH